MRRFLQLLILSSTISSFAQDGSIDFSFNHPTGVTDGVVSSTVIQSDGKIIVGGDFTLLNNRVSNKLARLNIDGTIDESFNLGLGFNNTVNGINIQFDGKILVVGDFTTYNGISKNRIVRLNIDGSIDTTFNIGTGANDILYAVKIQADGKILVLGRFTSFNGNSKNNIVRLNVDGTIDSTFNLTTGTNYTINSCVIQSDGKILIAGYFTLVNGVARNRIARLNIDGTLDTTFTSNIAVNSYIKTVCLQSDGKIIIGGNFTSYNGTSVNYIARLNPDSTLDTTFNVGTGFDSYVNSIIIQADGKLVIGGNFYSYNSTDCKRIARLNIDGSIDSAFSLNAGTDTAVNSIAIQSNGKILLGGTFSYCNTFTRNRIASINANGSIDTGFYPFLEDGISTDGQIRTIFLQPNGKIIIGGLFTTYNGLSSKNIARLNSDGTVDATFNVGTGANGMVKKVAVTSNNKIIIAGDFTAYNGVTSNRIAQLNADGTLDTTFNSGGSGANNPVNTFSIQTDGKIVIGGQFTLTNGIARNHLARLNANGTLDTSFNTVTVNQGTIWTTSIQLDGKIIIGGLALLYNDIRIGDIARLNTNGTLDTTFNVGGVGTDYFVYTSSIQTDGKIILTGSFSNYNTIPSKGVVRLNTNGSLDTSFNCPVLYGNVAITSSAIQNDGKIIFGGGFNAFNASVGDNIMRLNTDGTLDATLVTGTGFSSNVSALAIQNDGKILAGGNFGSYNQTAIAFIARLNNSNNLSTNDFNQDIKINVYPNPVDDYLKFSLPNGINISSFEVFDITGKKIDSNILNTNFIDVNNYIDGIYFLRLKTDKGILICKFIKN
jgi:uncharacterized delta-60 repeat protein